ncbi:ATP phosphoribosyltransferase [Bacteroidota bacterium]
MEKIRIAVQKSGRLSEKSLELIEETGIKLNNGNRKLIEQASNFPLEILYLRDDDIPQSVEDCVADVGIVGLNEVEEKKKNVKVIEKLGFSKCRMSLAIPKNIKYTGIEFFNNKVIATSYPGILDKYLKNNDIEAEIHEISGSVEIAPGIGMADAIFDIVSSGSTLISNGLTEVETVLNSQAVMIGNVNISEKKNQILDELIFRIHSVQKARKNKYILLNAPNNKLNEIFKILPGMKSPTVLPLAIEGWSSVHSVIGEDDFWEIIGKLKETGAEGILVIPIEKMII